MTKDKERDDALIAEAISGFPGNAFTAQMLAQAVLRLERSGWQPKPDRAEVLAGEVISAANIVSYDGYYELDEEAVTTIIRRHFAELRAEWEAERPVDSGMSGDAVKDAEWLWVNLPTRIKWTSLETHEKALVCHTVARLRAKRPAVVVPFGDDVIAAARFYADVPVAESRIVIMANAILDGAKGGE